MRDEHFVRIFEFQNLILKWLPAQCSLDWLVIIDSIISWLTIQSINIMNQFIGCSYI